MPIASPREPVYYYEVSRGDFRLVYFLPPQVLEQLAEAGRITEQARRDFPDGVDLTCMQPDFDAFERQYGFRHRFSANALRRAFFAILSSTRDWENFRGSGLIPAQDLELQVDTVEGALRGEPEAAAEVKRGADRGALEGRQQRMSREVIEASPAFSLLERMPVEGVDPGRSLREQQFSPIAREPGEPPEELFSKLQRKGRSE